MYKLTINKTVEQDTYAEGAIPETFTDYGDISTTFTNKADLVKAIHDFVNEDYYEIDEEINCIVYQRLEDANGIEVTKTDDIYGKWMQGEAVLYSVTYQLFASELQETDLDIEKLFKGVLL